MTDFPQLSPDAERAIKLLHGSRPRIYLGARYGLTPHTRISPDQADLFVGAKVRKEHHEPLCEIASIVTWRDGRDAMQAAFADKYSALEPKADNGIELELLRPFAVGKIVTTGSYSNRIVGRLGHVVTAVDEASVSNIRTDANSRSISLVMLHGWQSSPNSTLITREEVDAFDTNRKGISALAKHLLTTDNPWIILGYKTGEDKTFSRLCTEACEQIKGFQRPIYVVDPAETETVSMDWLRDPFRHVRMSVEDFLRAAASFNEAKPQSKPGPSTPPPSPPDAPDFVPDPDEPEPPPIDLRDGDGDKDEVPPADPGPEAVRRIEMRTFDGRAFQTQIPGTIRISSLASQFIRRFVHGDAHGSRRERAVVEIETEDGWERCRGDATADEAGVRDGSRLRAFNETTAGGLDPRRREAYLNDVQLQLEELARQDDRVQVKPNLHQASDRYELTLSCGGWLPPEATGIRPRRSFEQKLRLEYPAEAPNVAPTVWWLSKVYHPNVHPKTGYVCLGALQESWTPLFGPQELVRMLIELSEYRNYELRGVLNRDAAIWAQLNPDVLVEQGGWAYQPTLEDEADDGAPLLVFEDLGTGVGLRRRRKS